jgi:hypothetical protein
MLVYDSHRYVKSCKNFITGATLIKCHFPAVAPLYRYNTAIRDLIGASACSVSNAIKHNEHELTDLRQISPLHRSCRRSCNHILTKNNCRRVLHNLKAVILKLFKMRTIKCIFVSYPSVVIGCPNQHQIDGCICCQLKSSLPCKLNIV